MVLDYYHQQKIYHSGFESFCDLNCIGQILSSQSVNNPFLYIDCSLNFSLDVFLETDGYNSYLVELTKSRTVLPQFQQGILKHYYEGVDPNEIFLENIRKIKLSNIPIAVGMDIKYLPYNNKEFKNTHAWHTAILCGCKEDMNEIYVVDWSEPWFFQGAIDRGSFILSRDSKNEYNGDIYSGMPVMNYWIEVDASQFQANERELVHQVFEKSLHQYYESESVNAGLSCLIKVLNIVKAQDFNVPDFTSFFNNLYRMFAIEIKKYILFKQYIELAKLFINENVYNKLMSSLERTVELARIILIVILKLSHAGKQFDRKPLLLYLNTLIENEKNTGEYIRKCLLNVK